jgi:hypothetical protein
VLGDVWTWLGVALSLAGATAGAWLFFEESRRAWWLSTIAWSLAFPILLGRFWATSAPDAAFDLLLGLSVGLALGWAWLAPPPVDATQTPPGST